MDFPTTIRGQVRFLAVMAGSNFLLPYSASIDLTRDFDYVLMAIFSGLIAGQIGALSLWFVWASGNLWLRVVWLGAAAMVLCPPAIVGVLAGAAADGAHMTPYNVVQTISAAFVILPPICLAVQAALWPWRLLFGWRLESQLEQSPERPLSILDLMSGTALIAGALGCLRLLPVIFDDLSHAYLDADYWISCGVFGVAMAAASALLVIPLMAIVLGPRAGAAAATGGCAFTIAPIVLSCLALSLPSLYYSGHGRPGEMLVILAVLVFSSLATLDVPLFMARSQGFRLKIGRGVKTI